MTTAAFQTSSSTVRTAASKRANALAERLEAGARALGALAGQLTDTQLQTRLPGD